MKSRKLRQLDRIIQRLERFDLVTEEQGMPPAITETIEAGVSKLIEAYQMMIKAKVVPLFEHPQEPDK